MDTVRLLVTQGERQFRAEKAAAVEIECLLKHFGIDFVEQKFVTSVPKTTHASLLLDGEQMAVLGTALVSGRINDADGLLSSLLPAECTSDEININFNPASAVISRSNHYFAPSLAIARQDVGKVLAAKKVVGRVKVERRRQASMNILVGNRRTPQHVFICHYDSLGPGATDNAAGVAVLLELARATPALLTKTLLVFAGNEELSFDKPYYWGHGYRVFARTYATILSKAKTINVVDCVGNGKTMVDQSPAMVRLALPIPALPRLMKKVTAIYGSEEKLMHVYHSEADTIEQVEEKYLADALRVCRGIAIK